MSDTRETDRGARRIAVQLAEQGQRDIGRACLARFEKAGFARGDVAILQPSEPFFELSGEDIRSRLFLTGDAEGVEMCLRPEFTIPAALDYLKRGIAGRRADQAFLGPVFRHRQGESGEFIQFSAESFGRKDREAADADMLAETMLALKDARGSNGFHVRIGDLALFEALISGLSLGPALRRRLAHGLGDGRIASMIEAALSGQKKPEKRGLARYSGVLDALKGADPKEARAFVKDLLSIAGIAATGGRTAEDIASRFLDRADDNTQALSKEQAGIISRFLAISGDPDSMATELRGLSEEAGLDMNRVLDAFEQRTGFLEARGLDVAAIEARAGFARNLDYYSGFVFEISQATGAEKPLAGGGRYDRLFERLGAEVPAIGAAVWIARIDSEASAK